MTVYYCLVPVDLWHPGWVRESELISWSPVGRRPQH